MVSERRSSISDRLSRGLCCLVTWLIYEDCQYCRGEAELHKDRSADEGHEEATGDAIAPGAYRAKWNGDDVKTVLFIAYYFPPILAPGAMRPLGFCRYLETYGWRPWVLTTSPGSVYPPHQMDEELLDRLPPGLKIESVPYSNLLNRMIA